MNKYDVVIVGAGSAGMTAAIYTCRKNLKTVIISVDVGGQTNLTNHIENYPGTGVMSGPELMQKFKLDAEKFGAEFIGGKVTKLEKKENEFLVTVNGEEKIKARAVILAFGRIPRSLGIPGEEKFFGRGVSTCATCDGPLFKNKNVAVIGGGNSALEGALELAEVANQVYLVHRRDTFRGDETTVEKVKKKQNIELVLNHVPVEVQGEKFVTGLIVKNEKERTLKIDGVFIEVGSVVDTSFAKDLVKTNEKNEVIINASCATSCPGIFAAGDVTNITFKQTVISAGEGAKAALECYTYLSNNKGPVIDWH
ncbi:hypothetical protein COV11_02635 [Candidatus Woesearchaeota archaeon CG10_big_fil_rev_8_21_14_0_10_30_7]|nr:MAG: hypothetical protein COV11_02635 [Candidatus Woesearchaeota archaeon CG10_big_fil_rev_8_21_14_0_10_30_7]